MAIPSFRNQLQELLSEQPAQAMARERSTFDQISAAHGQRIVLFGAGNIGRKAVRVLLDHGVTPLAVVDDSPALQGTQVEGVQVIAAEEAVRRFGGSATFVVAFFTPVSSYLAVEARLLGLGCATVVPFIPLFWKYGDECMPYVQLDLPHRILAEKGAVQQAFDLLGDDVSRREYLGQMKLRLRYDYQALPPPSDGEQYFPDDLFAVMPGEVFIDCGAFDGDTVRAVMKRQPDFGRIVAVEPDPVNFHRLQEFISQLPDATRQRITARHSAVGAMKQTVRFDADGTSASHISERGGVEVDCDALDAMLKEVSPTFIKMDVEGAELDALAGAKKLMAQNKAVWAICVYHKSEDLWKVPLTLAAHTTGYSFFLRKYVGEVWESVVFAVPRSRRHPSEGQ